MTSGQFDILTRMARTHETIAFVDGGWKIGRRAVSTRSIGLMLLNGWIERHKEPERFRIAHKGRAAVTAA